MVPFGLTLNQFVNRYKRCLNRASPHLIDELRSLFIHHVPSSVKSAEVQIFLGEDGLDRPAAWIYYSGDNNKIDSSNLSIFPGRSMKLSIGLESMDKFDESYFTDPEFGGLSAAANAIKSWFAECWWKAGGWNYLVPARVVVHDDFGDGENMELSEHR
jgi:hypothetical protein